MSIYELQVARLAATSDPATNEAFDRLTDEGDLSGWVQPIDWAQFWSSDAPEQEWVVEPIVPKGRQVAMYAAPKQGKSLLALDAAAARATGRSVFGQRPQEPVDVVYIDQEMAEADLRERLEDLGYGPDVDLSRLHYFQLVNLPALDSELGGQVLEAIVTRHGADLVVLDTMARVVVGDENVADTYRNFFRFTGRRLKALEVALWRLDHGGKDPERGQRGSSEKAGDVDVVFRLRQVDDSVILKRTHTRVPWVPPEITFTRQSDPLAHVIGTMPVSTAVLDVIAQLERLGVPVDASGNTAHKALQTAGCSRRRTDVLEAVKIRKARS